MAKLYGSMQGNRGQVTRTGVHDMSAHIRTWESGIETEIIARDDGTFLMRAWLTGGSNGSRARMLAYVTTDADGNVIHEESCTNPS